ncbi:MAG: galactose-1-phosphate uridylyltransferase [Nitrospirota bacterium]|jgi:UDPglucose--hexose-1-phosphate uridylyltransferase
MKESQVRQNKATRQWVIFAPERRRRPTDFMRPREGRTREPEHDPDCPFCPGNEGRLPDIIEEVRDARGRWLTRVVPNKFPALTPTGELARSREGIYLAMGGFGHHEVIVETPLHNLQPGQMSEEEAGGIVRTYLSRYRVLTEEEKTMMVIVFRNHGERAGTSLRHPHSQLIATGMVPHHVRWREEEAERYFDEWGRCVFCDILEFEERAGLRVVLANASFLVFVPYAAEVPFELWVMPRIHRADFGDMSEEEARDLASALRGALGILHRRLGDPDYNMVVNTSARYRAGEPRLHWYVQVRPRLLTAAGFEIGSGIGINPSLPEDDAAFLRGEGKQ